MWGWGTRYTAAGPGEAGRGRAGKGRAGQGRRPCLREVEGKTRGEFGASDPEGGVRWAPFTACE